MRLFIAARPVALIALSLSGPVGMLISTQAICAGPDYDGRLQVTVMFDTGDQYEK